jgi:hypothetical protein
MSFLPPEKLIGGVAAPENPFKQAVPPKDWDDKIQLANEICRETCKKASLPYNTKWGYSIEKVVLAAQEEINPNEPIKSAQRLAATYLMVQSDPQIDSEARWATLRSLSKIASHNINNVQFWFDDFLDLLGARLALEEAKNPKDKSLIESAARGETQALERLNELNPHLYTVVRMTTDVNKSFWSRLEANAEANLRIVERSFKNKRAKRLLRSTYDSDARAAINSIAEVTREFHGCLEKLKNVNPDLRDVVRDLVKDAFNKGAENIFISKDKMTDEISRRENNIRSYDAQRADRLSEAAKNRNVMKILNIVQYCTQFMNNSYKVLITVNQDLAVGVRNEVHKFFNKEGASPVSGRDLVKSVRRNTIKYIRSSDVRVEQKWEQKRHAADALGARGRAEVERD